VSVISCKVPEENVSDYYYFRYEYSSVIVELVQVVLVLVGPLVAELLVLLIGNGSAGVILGLKLGPLINCLGLGNLLQGLLGSLLWSITFFKSIYPSYFFFSR
jgi:hypothetical protein